MEKFYKCLNNVLKKNYDLDNNDYLKNNKDYINNLNTDVNNLDILFDKHKKYNVEILKNLLVNLYDSGLFMILSQKIVYQMFQNIIWQEPKNVEWFLRFSDYMGMFGEDWLDEISEIKESIKNNDLDKAYKIAITIRPYE